MRAAIVLVGHGGVPSDAPRALVAELRRLEAERRARGGEPSAREREVERTLRAWPRRPETDPYQAGLAALADRLAPRLHPLPLMIAYNEFCAPSVAEAIDGLVAQGCQRITLLTTMVTPGGSHAERDIPEHAEAARLRHPGVDVTYAWPFDLEAVVSLFEAQLRRYLVA